MRIVSYRNEGVNGHLQHAATVLVDRDRFAAAPGI